MIKFQKESFIDIMEELPELFDLHWQEVALDKKSIPLDPDWKRYIDMDSIGMLHVVTVRDDGILIGYYLAIVAPHLHYKSSLTAWSDIFYILPDYRRSGGGLSSTGYKLFRHVDKMFKELGVRKSYVMTKRHLPINILMKRLGYRLIEKVYAKLL